MTLKIPSDFSPGTLTKKTTQKRMSDKYLLRPKLRHTIVTFTL